MPSCRQMPHGIARRTIVVDADVRHAHVRVELAARNPWQRARIFGQRVLHRVGIEADRAIGAVAAQHVEVAALAARIGTRVAQQRQSPRPEGRGLLKNISRVWD